MARRPRTIVPGVAHHVMQRGNNLQPVFYYPDDRRLYLKLLTKHAALYGTRILGYCLMKDHVHLIAVPEHEDSLARTFGRTHAAYAQALNQVERRTGHLWQNRFFSCPLDAEYLEIAMRFVESNPVRAGLSLTPWDWEWSSAAAHSTEGVADPVLASDWTERDGGWDCVKWRDWLFADVPPKECDLLRRNTRSGEPLGSPEFLARLEQRVGRRLRVLARGRPRKTLWTPNPPAPFAYPVSSEVA